MRAAARVAPQAATVVPAKVRMPSAAALARDRLEARLGDAFEHRLTLLVAPAGSGKTTLLAQFAAACGAPVGWYRAEALDRDEAALVRHLEASLIAVLPRLAGGWASVDDAVVALEALRPSGPALIVIDDFHALEGTGAEAAFARFVDFAPAWLSPVIATRVAPGLNLTRLRIAGDLLELGPDDLRFRSWEVEQLFRDVYHDPVPPADLAALARRTEGWAAGLQLFHLATRDRSATERRRLLGGPGSSGRILREYLAQNVMVDLPPDLRSFLLDTCVLGRLSGPLCDRLRGAGGGGAYLAELARRGVFTAPAEDQAGADAYRYHEVLRQHLDRMLVEEVGEAVARERHAEAGRLLETEGWMPEALRAYCRAEDWDAVRRLLGGNGEELAAGAASWIDAMPPAIERHDPWVALAVARHARNAGRFPAALLAYARAEDGLAPARSAEVPRRERLMLAAWVDHAAIPPADASGLLRTGLVKEPLTAGREAARSDDPVAPLVRGLLALASGEPAHAARHLAGAIDDEAAGPIARAAADLGIAVAGVLAGTPSDGRDFDGAAESAERAGLPWLARLARDLRRVLGPAPGTGGGLASHPTGAAHAQDRSSDDAEPWSEALVALATAWAAPYGAPDAVDDAEAAADRFRRLGAGVLEAWARSIGALAAACAGSPDARDQVLAAESLGRATGIPATRELAHASLLALGEGVAAGAGTDGVGSGHGLAVPRWATAGRVDRGEATDTETDTPTEGARAEAGAPLDGRPERLVRIRTFGGCALEVEGRRVPLEGAKPRVRSLFRLLALQAGGLVHREVIQETLWPDADAAAGARSLHVALSALRRLLDDVAQPVGGRLVVREGDAYRLDVEPDDVDLGRFERAIASGRAARARGGTVSRSLEEAIRLYAGDLLPEEGPAEWVAERRDACRVKAIEAARGLAEEALLANDPAAAIRACRFGLELDRCQDALWQLLIVARERAGEAGAASRDRREYALVLEALGVAPQPAGVG
jgi:DNA-binding SARP family transcriptional activator